MALLGFLAVSFVILAAGYLVGGHILSRVFRLDDGRVTPAHSMRDALDFEPARTSYLLPQHFSAIAAAGPIVGPILAAMYFGWGPAWLWILFGSILIGGIHDLSALVASVRHRARSVAEIVRRYMNPRAYVLFLIFIWSSLIYVIVAFTDVTAGTFVAAASRAGADAPGPAVASSSALYLMLAVLMGFALRYLKMNPVVAKMIFLPLVVVAILAGPWIPMDMGKWVGAANAQQAWGYALLAYCFVAAMAPVWSLLQPRGELGGYFLYIVMGICLLGAGIGAITGHVSIVHPFFKGWQAKDALGTALPLMPILFITVACGACSGFHSIVASGTTSKQLNRENDARPIGYGGMLLEAFLACISLATVMILAPGAAAGKSPNWVYANGVAQFGTYVFAPILPKQANSFDFIFQFGLLCFATFVFDTLDACTRLARYVFMELAGWTTRTQAMIATALSLAVPAIAVSLPRVQLGGKPQPLWQVFWGIFGSSNQLLAALTLLGVTVWMARKKMAFWIAMLPAVFMMAVTLWSLTLGIKPYLRLLGSGAKIESIRHLQFGITVSLLVLSVWLVVEAVITWRQIVRPKGGPPAGMDDEPEPEPEAQPEPVAVV